MSDQSVSNPSESDESFYKEGARRMIDEGLELASKIIHYMGVNKDKLDKLDRKDRKRTILKEREDFNTFAQVHPIVFEYLAVEAVFNRNAFKRYIRAAFGKPKTDAEQAEIARDKRNVYYFKNKQYALYSKYLMQETNPHVSIDAINQAYNSIVAELNSNTKQMLDQFEEAQKKTEARDAVLSEEKRAELIEALKQRLGAD